MNRPRIAWIRFSVAVALGLALLFSSSCRLNTHPEYPNIPIVDEPRYFGIATTPTWWQYSSDLAIKITPEPVVNLKVAGPWSATDLDLLGKYFSLLQANKGRVDQQSMTGEQVSIAELTGTASRVAFSTVPLSIEENLTDEMAKRWTASANWPDIVMGSSESDVIAQQSFVDLTPLLIDNPNLASDQANANLIKLCQTSQGLLHLPWRVTLPVLYYNRALLADAAVDEPADSLSWPAFNNLIDRLVLKFKQDNRLLDTSLLSQMTNAGDRTKSLDQDILLFANPEVMIEFWPAAYTADLGWSSWDGHQFNFEHQAFAEGVSQIRELVHKGAAINAKDPIFIDHFGSTDQLIKKGQVVFWIGDSRDMASLQANPSDDFGYSLLPLSQSDRILRLPVRLLTLSVSNSCLDKALAASIAAFLSFDTDALQLQARLEAQEGLFPAITDPQVWETYLKQQKGGKGLSELPAVLPYAYTGGQLDNHNWNSLIEQIMGSHSSQLLTGTNPQREIKQMQMLADQLTE